MTRPRLSRQARRGAAALLLGVVAPAVATAVSAADLADIQRRGALRVLVMPAPDEAHFFSIENGAAPGFDHEILLGFTRLHRLSIEIEPVSSWDELVPALLGGRGDVIAGAFTDTTARREQINFTSEVFPTRNVIVTRAPSSKVETLEALRSLKRVGCVRGTSPCDALEEAGLTASAIDDGIASGGLTGALREGRVEALVLEAPAAILARRDDAKVQIGLFLGRSASLAYGVRKQDEALLRALNEYLHNQRRSLGWSRLVAKYFGAAAPEILEQARKP